MSERQLRGRAGASNRGRLAKHATVPVAANGESTRTVSSANQLLEATSQILTQRNSIDVSFSEIAEKSGLNSALIKYHFGSKEGLLVALVRRDAATSLQQLDWLVQMRLPPDKKIRLHVKGIINTYVKYPYLNRLIHTLLTGGAEAITQEITDFFVKPLVDSQSKILDEGVQLGYFRQVQHMFFYYSILGACDHLFFGRYSRKHVYGVDEISEKMKDEYIGFVTDLALQILKVG
jgi:AcrR family transcriptional regulator